MKNALILLSLIFISVSCASLKSNTVIKPNDNFILGSNKHGTFKVKLENLSKNAVEIYLAPIDGGKHSPQTVAPNQIISIKVDKNSALVIVNNTADTSSVNLKVTGDLGLSMKYKN